MRLAGRRSALLAGLAAALVGAMVLAGTTSANAAYHNARYTLTFPVLAAAPSARAGGVALAGPTAKQANAVRPGRIAPRPAHAGRSGAASGPGDPRREPLTVPQPFIPSDGQAPDRPGATGTVPAAPSRLAAKVAGSSVSLTWTNNATTPAATVVWIQRATNARFTQNWTDTAVRPAATSYTDKSAAAGTTYYYRVLAQNPAGNSPWSNAVSILLPPRTRTVPAAPSRLAAKVAGSSVSLTWTNNATTPAATVVWIQRATNARFTQNWTDTAVRPAATSYTDKSAAAGTTYYYRVLAQNPAGNSPWSNAVSILLPPRTRTVPAAPSRLAAKVAGSSVSLTWTNNATTPAATVVWIQRATNARFTQNWTDTAVRPAATSYTDKSAAAGTTYYYRVLAQNPAGNSPWSNAVSILVPAPPVGTAPAITSAAGAAVSAAAGGSFTVTTTGSPAPALTVTGALPPGTAFTDNGDGTATLQVPAGAAAGSYPVTLTATNSISAATQAFTLTVGTAPAITSAAGAAVTAAAGGSFTVTTTGSPAPALTVTGALPAGTAFTDNGDGTATLQVPAGAAAGSYPVTLTATNSIAAATQAFTLTVGTAPAITSAAGAAVTAAAGGSFTVTTTGSPAPALTVTGALPAGTAFTDNGDGTATLQVPAGAAAGSYPVTLTATNSLVRRHPGLHPHRRHRPRDHQRRRRRRHRRRGRVVHRHHHRVPRPRADRHRALPAGTAFTDNGDGTATLQVPAGAAAGSYPVTLTATNSLSAATQAFTLTVGTAPAITSAAGAAVTAAAGGSFTVTTTGSPAPALTVTGPLPPGTAFTDNGDGTATLQVPAGAAAGSYPVTLPPPTASPPPPRPSPSPSAPPPRSPAPPATGSSLGGPTISTAPPPGRPPHR